MAAPEIGEVIVTSVKDEEGSEVSLQAEIYPDQSFAEGKTEEEIYKAVKAAVEAVNDKIPSYKKVTKVVIRKTEFEKTTSRKIKRKYN